MACSILFTVLLACSMHILCIYFGARGIRMLVLYYDRYLIRILHPHCSHLLSHLSQIWVLVNNYQITVFLKLILKLCEIQKSELNSNFWKFKSLILLMLSCLDGKGDLPLPVKGKGCHLWNSELNSWNCVFNSQFQFKQHQVAISYAIFEVSLSLSLPTLNLPTHHSFEPLDSLLHWYCDW